MPINKEYPQYPEYLASCKQLFDEAADRVQDYLQEYPDWNGQDHPNAEKIKAVIDTRNKEFHKLKQAYGFERKDD